MTNGEVILICYVAVVTLGVLRMRKGMSVFDLLVFAVNTGVIFWLLFLYGFLSSGENGAWVLSEPSDSWILWCCGLLSVLLIPATIRGIALGATLQQKEVTPDERMAALQSLRSRYPRAVVTLILGAFWMIFIGRHTFGYLRSHSWLITLGIAASVGFGWIILALVKRWPRHKGTMP